ncbi:MAG: LCP family protein [Nocardioidaceae bacterium]
MTVLLALIVAMGAAAVWYVNDTLGSIDRFESAVKPEQRAVRPTAGPAAEALNILLLGTDKGHNEQTIKAELADGEWTRGAFRSDTIMILHIPKDRATAYLVSIPRDSYVDIPGNGRQKVNAAFSFGGPDLALRTIEDLTGVYIDHTAMVDWDGFKDLTTAIGGVEVEIPESFTSEGRTWTAGTERLEGKRALDYVRTRYGLPNGDFDRIKRQQNFLRATMEKAASQGTLTNPVKLKNLLGAIADNTTVDSGFSTGTMRDLATDLRSIRGDDFVYLTAPFGGYDDVPGVGSVVLLDGPESKALWKALRDDDMGRYLEAYQGDRLGSPASVR